VVQSEKMSSLGQLVAGVAHEINNPVNFIHGNLTHAQEYTQDLLAFVQLYQRHYPTSIPEIEEAAEAMDLEFLQADLPKMLASMKVGTERIRQIVLSLRNFSRMDEAELKPVDIHEGLNSTLMILHHRLKARPERPEIEVIKNYARLPLVECYAGQINQVFMNILVNAIDALEEFNTGRTYEKIQKHPSQITIETTLMDSRWVQVAISDNGSGMSEPVRQQIFHPFFTTKPIGKGTGMGMAISYQIIEKHQGKLICSSTLNQGTEFLIQIPIRPLPAQ
jgi:signal transduction histidine kinase